MLTRKQLEDEIAEYEGSEPTWKNCLALSALYTLRDHLYEPKEPYMQSFAPAPVEAGSKSALGLYGDTDFYKAVYGAEPEAVFAVLDELMQTLMIINPKLYRAVLKKIEKI